MTAQLRTAILRGVLTRQAARAGKARDEFARLAKLLRRPVTGRPPKARSR